MKKYKKLVILWRKNVMSNIISCLFHVHQVLRILCNFSCQRKSKLSIRLLRLIKVATRLIQVKPFQLTWISSGVSQAAGKFRSIIVKTLKHIEVEVLITLSSNTITILRILVPLIYKMALHSKFCRPALQIIRQMDLR